MNDQQIVDIINFIQNNYELIEKKGNTEIKDISQKHFQYTKIEAFLNQKLQKLQCQQNKHKYQNDQCPICITEIYEEEIQFNMQDFKNQLINFDGDNDSVYLHKCVSHYFHINCCINLSKQNQNFIKCPVCFTIYGIQTGNQPEGTMKHKIDKNTHCESYKNCGTIVIDYVFSSGKNYSGTSRRAFLPDNKEGNEVLSLFRVAFDRKLIFTIGRSVTTGQDNQTVWNGIHHKTNLSGGSSNFGYPDPDYFRRVKEELAAKGITPESIKNLQ